MFLEWIQRNKICNEQEDIYVTIVYGYISKYYGIKGENLWSVIKEDWISVICFMGEEVSCFGLVLLGSQRLSMD